LVKVTISDSVVVLLIFLCLHDLSHFSKDYPINPDEMTEFMIVSKHSADKKYFLPRQWHQFISWLEKVLNALILEAFSNFKPQPLVRANSCLFSERPRSNSRL